MPSKKDMSASTARPSREERHDQLTAVVKDIVNKQKAVQDTKTARLREQRLVQEAADETTPPKSKTKTKAKGSKTP
jgi:hypothetical protein